MRDSRLRCPFCNGVISDQLATYGGPCTHCMLEIPGEEAPTDPGLAKKQAAIQAERAAQQTAARSRTLALGSFGALVAAVFVAVVFLARDDSGHLYLEFYKATPAERRAREEAEVAAPVDVGAGVKAGKKAVRSSGAAPQPGGSQDDGDIFAGVGDAAPPGGAVNTDLTFRSVATTSGGSANVGAVAVGSGALPTMQVGTVTGATLTAGSVSVSTSGPAVAAVNAPVAASTPAAAKQLIDDGYGSYKRQFGSCVTTSVNADPNFGGTWTLQFTVEKDGTTTNHSVRGARPNQAFEACLLQKMRTWRFRTLAEPYTWRGAQTFGREY